MCDDEILRFGGAVVNPEAMCADFILGVSQIRKWRPQLTGVLKRGRSAHDQKQSLAKTKEKR